MPLALNDSERLSVQNLLSNYSVELTPPQSSRIGRFADLLAPNTRIYIPHTPHVDLADIVALAVRLRNERMEPVPTGSW